MRYEIWDPTGNITALVDDEVEVALQPCVGRRIMEAHPEVEQVGFVRTLDAAGGHGAVVELRMAGGEFCGNASMCAAAWFAEKTLGKPMAGKSERVLVGVWGAKRPVEVRVSPGVDGLYHTSIRMPSAQGMEETSLCLRGSVTCVLPVIRMEGITHVVIRETSPAHCLCHDAHRAEEVARRWCTELGAEGLGLMFLEGEGRRQRLTPLVYIPVGDTMFWENSCASGSAAVGAWIAHACDSGINLELEEPGGTLRVCVDGDGLVTLYGATRKVLSHE